MRIEKNLVWKIEDHILFNDDHILILNKPAGLLSQPDKTQAPDVAETLKTFLTQNNSPTPFLAAVHRLDRNTTGTLVLAKNQKIAQNLSDQIFQNKMERHYSAIAKGDTGDEGTINLPLTKNEKTNEVRVDPKGKSAITNFKRIEKLPNSSFLDIWLETGRSHQIRVHLAHEKHPLLGDKKYAPRPWCDIFHRPALHARSVKFAHPITKNQIFVEAPLPDDMKELLQSLR